MFELMLLLVEYLEINLICFVKSLALVLNVRKQCYMSQLFSCGIPDCSARGPRFESHHGWLCISQQPF